MKYCPNCLEEYQDDAKTCPDCNGQALLTEEEIAQRPGLKRVREDEDTTSFAPVANAEDLFEADAFTAAVGEAGIPVMARMRRSSTLDTLTSVVQAPWWEVLVPEADKARAAEIIEARRKELEAAVPEAEQAVEEEDGEPAKA